MKIQAVTMGITHPCDPKADGKWYDFAQWTSKIVEENLGLKAQIISNEFLELGNKSNPWDQITSIKMLLFKIFPDADRIFFFDADWRPVRKFNLFDYVPEKEGLYFVTDRPKCEELRIRYKMKNPYFNTGFFIADKKYEYLFDFCYKNYDKYQRTFWEQCVMNQVFDGYVTYLDPRLNVKDLGIYPQSEILGYHCGNNYLIFNDEFEEFDWN